MITATNSEILIAALALVAAIPTCYIDIAIAYSKVGTAHKRKALKDGIELILHGHSCYEIWLVTNYPTLPDYTLSDDEYEKQFRPGRLAWLDSMIAEEIQKESK